MSRFCVTPDRLFDRTWRAGHPFRPRTGRLRRWAMIMLLVVLSLTIGGYGYLTDSRRVRVMAELYLTRLIGGRVEVEDATLSIFEGLRLKGVTVHVDDDLGAPDSVIFKAQTFVIHYDPRLMVAGQLEADQIIAEKPQVLLTRSPETGMWNYRRLGHSRNRRPRPTVSAPSRPPMIPEILLRNARLEVAELVGAKRRELGFMAVDGRIAPASDAEHYTFELQSRGTEGVGPFVSGSVAYATGQVSAQLRNFEFGPTSEFGRDLQAMLPADVREWWERHNLAGRLDIPLLRWTPPREGHRAAFKLETNLNGVTLAVHPEEWLEAHEVQHLTDAKRALELMRPLYVAGGFKDARPTPPSRGTVADPVSHAQLLLAGNPITLRQVAGSFVFTQDGIDVHDVGGRIENNGFRVGGHIDGYRPDASMFLRISSLQSENIYIPPSPRYVSSLPKQVRSLYDDLRPQGTCNLEVQLERKSPGARPEARGHIDVVNGEFVFGLFPYPLREATGRISFGPDSTTGKDVVRITGLRGRGVATGPNRDTVVTIDGVVGPIDPDDPGNIGADVHIAGKAITCEPTLDRAFPPEVRRALQLVGASEVGGMPLYHGDFATHVFRAPGPGRHWTFDTDLDVDDASGALAGFPYPLRHVAGRLQVRDGYVDVIGAQARRGDAMVGVDGRVSWVDASQTRLALKVRGMPLDAELLGALPAERRGWLQKLGVSGKVDVDGVITQPRLPTPEAIATTAGLDLIDYDLAITLRDGAVHPAGGELAATDLAGKLHLTPARLRIEELRARRDKSTLAMSGGVLWTGTRSHLTFDASAENVTLDAPLCHALPAGVRSAWDELQPQGTVDAHFTFDGPAETLTLDSAPPAAASDSIAPASSSQVVIRPRELSVTLRSAPYRLDHVAGIVTLTPRKITLTDVTARHDDAMISVAGTGALGDRAVWDLRVSGKGVSVDDSLRKALPPSLRAIVDALKLHGVSDFAFSRFTYRAPAAPPVSRDGPHPATAPSVPPAAPEIDLTATVALQDGDLDVGVPLQGLNGSVTLDAEVRDSRLTSMTGKIDVSRLTMAGREVRDLRADVIRPRDQNELQLAHVQAKLAGGAMAGQMSVVFPDDGPSRYNLDLVLRDADVRALTPDPSQDIRGRLSASLSLEGAWDDPAARRGRGDVSVEGKEMYHIPLVLGLLQVTNLALPIAEPFHQASARYNLDGQRVTFEKIELRSDTMRMSGTGHLDFGTKQVRMSFTTDNPGGLKVPFLADLWQGARNELLRINVRGTIQDPKVETSTMNTFSTTVDEVFRGDAKK